MSRAYSKRGIMVVVLCSAADVGAVPGAGPARVAAAVPAVHPVRHPHAAQLRAQPHPVRADAPAQAVVTHQPLPLHRALLQAGEC